MLSDLGISGTLHLPKSLKTPTPGGMALPMQLESLTARNESRHAKEKPVPPKMLGFLCDLWGRRLY